MSLQFSTTIRNGILDQMETLIGTSAVIKIFTGSIPANCNTADSGTLLVQFNLASDWWATASGGAKTLNSLPLSAVAVASGTAGYFRIYDSAVTACHLQGTVVQTGGPTGDMAIDNTNINNGQTITLVTFTITSPGA